MAYTTPVRIERGKAAQIAGLKELRDKLKEIMDATVGAEVREVVGDAAHDLERDIAARIMTLGRPAKLHYKESKREIEWLLAHGAETGTPTGMRKLTRAELEAQPTTSIGIEDMLRSLFVYNKQPAWATRKAMLTALVGMGKAGRMEHRAPAYWEWAAGKHPKSPRAKRAAGELVGESLGTMVELGTTKRPATPFFRPAVQAARPRIVETIAAGYRDILGRHLGTYPSK